QLVLGALGQARRLVDVQSDPVTQAMAEVASLAARLDHVPRGGVGVTTRYARPDSRQARALRRQDEVVDLAGATRGATGGDRARAVRAVAVDLGSPVDHHQIPGLDGDLARLGMG